MNKQMQRSRNVTPISRLTGDIDLAAKYRSGQGAISPQPSHAVARLKPYETVNQSALFLPDSQMACKLDWNESTQPPATEIIDAIVAELRQERSQWYPDVNSFELIEELSRYTGLPTENIQTFPGSDAALEYVCRAFLNADDHVLIVGPTYDNFRIYAESCGASTTLCLSDSPWRSDAPHIIDSVRNNTKLIYLVSPNNPTGALYTEREIRSILDAAPHALLIIDEAYFEFCGVTMSHLVTRYPNAIITRSFSKAFGLAALRCGYVLSNPTNIEYLNRIRVGKNLSAAAQAAALAALRNIDCVKRYVETVKQNRILLTIKLGALGIPAHTTPANFVMLEVGRPAEVIRFLRGRHIYIRDRSAMPQLERFVRVTVGDDRTTRAVIEGFEAMPREYYRIHDEQFDRTTRAMERTGVTQKITFRRKAEVAQPSTERVATMAAERRVQMTDLTAGEASE